MLYCNRLNCWYPDFCLVTHNQIRCFMNCETILDISNCDVLFLNQISGYKNNTILSSNYSIDSFDGYYQASPSSLYILCDVFSHIEPVFFRKRILIPLIFHISMGDALAKVIKTTTTCWIVITMPMKTYQAH